MHGVLLADESELNRIATLSFQDWSTCLCSAATAPSPEQLETNRQNVGSAPHWNGRCARASLSRERTSDYTPQDYQRAMEALQTQNAGLNTAVMELEERIPERLKMARKIKDEQWGANTLEADGRRLFLIDPISVKSRSAPPLTLPGHAFLDLYADGQLDDGSMWGLTLADGKTRTRLTLRIDPQRKCWLEAPDHRGIYRQMDGPLPSGKTLPDINAAFETAFKRYLATMTKAYQTLLASLLTSLPLAERNVLAQGEVEILRLRASKTPGNLAIQQKARKGFVLKATQGDDITYYEVIPSAGIIRSRSALRVAIIAGNRRELPLHVSLPESPYSPGQNTRTSLLLDLEAHVQGKMPEKKPHCYGFLDSVALVPPASAANAAATDTEAAVLAARLNAVAEVIASKFLYVDENELRTEARGMTSFDEIRARNEKRRETFVTVVKGFVPFWGSIEDLLSDSTTSKVLGGLGLLADLASFLFPIGKFISGSVRLIKASTGTARIAVKASLPSFSTLTRKLLISTVRNTNPLDVIPSVVRGVSKGLLGVGRVAVWGINSLRTSVAGFRLARNLPQAIDAGQWKPLNASDRLATLDGIDDVLVRQTNPRDSKQLHLVDPVTSLPYGPRLNNGRSLTEGRSAFKALPPSESHALAEIPDNARVREMFEVDGRTTMLIDDVPYRLDGNQLRRADLIDDQSMFKAMPCRLRRAGNNRCQTRYVTREPAATPAVGTFDEKKDYAPWFGDSIYTPANARQSMSLRQLKRNSQHQATMSFQKGIYGRLKVEIPSSNPRQPHILEAGATIVPAIDGSKHYVFTRLDAGDFYVAELAKGQTFATPLTLRKANTLPADLKDELMTVYTGSLNANNMARIHGVEAVKRAMKTMDEIAIPIGGRVNPPDTLKHLKVDTSPGEAVLFDHASRMIITRKPTSAAAWSRSETASAPFRQRAADIFDTLHAGGRLDLDMVNNTQINRTLHSDLIIDQVIGRVQNLIPFSPQTGKPRNIAYADIVTATGKREVYVSVSGGQGVTSELPLFKRPLANDSVVIGDTTYFNVDAGQRFARTSLNVSEDGRILAIPHTIQNIERYNPGMTVRPTSLDSEAKLISVLREKYPQQSMLKSVDVVTTLPPCNSCSVVIKEFGFNGSAQGLKVMWD